MADIPKLTHINLAQTLVKVSAAHARLHDVITSHAEQVAQQRKDAHDRLAAENTMKGL